MMELPVARYRNHRIGYTVLAIAGLLIACQGGFWLIKDGVLSFWGWLFLLIGLPVCTVSAWRAASRSVVLELNHNGIQHRSGFYGWHTLAGYAIRKEVGESSTFNYLVLRFNGQKEPLDIQLDWLENSESLEEHMAAYAGAFKISFDGLVRKEV